MKAELEFNAIEAQANENEFLTDIDNAEIADRTFFSLEPDDDDQFSHSNTSIAPGAGKQPSMGVVREYVNLEIDEDGDEPDSSEMTPMTSGLVNESGAPSDWTEPGSGGVFDYCCLVCRSTFCQNEVARKRFLMSSLVIMLVIMVTLNAVLLYPLFAKEGNDNDISAGAADNTAGAADNTAGAADNIFGENSVSSPGPTSSPVVGEASDYDYDYYYYYSNDTDYDYSYTDDGNMPDARDDVFDDNDVNSLPAVGTNFNNLKSFIVSSGVSYDSSFGNNDSPQSMALNYLRLSVLPDSFNINIITDNEKNQFLELFALSVFYYATGGRRGHTALNAKTVWLNDDNWMQSDNACGSFDYDSWVGVTCDDFKRVVELDLNGNSLKGQLPSEINGNAFKKLIFIDLSNNELEKNLPLELGSLSSLEKLYLSSNSLESAIPTHIGALSKLDVIYLSENYLTGPIPTEFGMMESLDQLGLYSNNLEGSIPPELGNLGETLTVIYLDDNFLDGSISESMCEQFVNVNDFRARQNSIGGSIPTEIGFMTNLISLYFDSMSLIGTIPRTIKHLEYLEELHVYDNELTGHVPTALGLLAELRDLYMDTNVFTGPIPSDLGLLENLENLGLFRNNLGQSIPTELGSAKELRSMHIFENYLTGPIPSQIGQLTKLEGLLLNDNLLTGTIPTQLGKLKKLENFTVDGNQLMGKMPDEVCKRMERDQLAYLSADCHVVQCDCCTDCAGGGYVSADDIIDLIVTQEISPMAAFDDSSSPQNKAIAYLVNFELDFAYDAMDTNSTGALKLIEAYALVTFYYSTGGERFFDVDTEETKDINTNGAWENENGWLVNPDVCYKQPNGVGWYGVKCNTRGNVEGLVVFGNKLSGSIPQEINAYALPYLEMIDFSQNEIMGKIPGELGEFYDLSDIDLSANQLTGKIPPELGLLQYLETLILRENKLTGSIPQTIGDLMSLETFAISSNTLRGKIPKMLGTLKNLTKIDLSDNDFTGELPTEIGDILYLEEFYMNDLTLGGSSLPTEIGLLENLRIFSAVHSEIGGQLPEELGDLDMLETLHLDENTLKGALPTSVATLSSMVTMTMSKNELSNCLPTQLAKMTSLRILELESNRFSCSIPIEFGSLTNLKKLYLHDNELVGEVPVELSELKQLQELTLYENDLVGEVPYDLCALTDEVSGNLFTFKTDCDGKHVVVALTNVSISQQEMLH
eukprot:CAMPEP_0194393674 /NCGR_PEP_ID=MMETSP0174-20130528/123430_1 /TAXON_ID=216777 /ORGANISM="Proboscia alata, Strain PI-D3" /LENGTH=1209 /DNA_ID=CAMNT_0039189385 /DNA_START=85 /DNA_END=3715 /DNA_ORIENTATION=-